MIDSCDIVNELINELYHTEKNIKLLTHKAEQLEENLNYQTNNKHKKHPLIVKRVLALMSAGVDSDNAILQTSIEYATTPQAIKNLLSMNKRYMTAVNLFAKRYCAQKLKKAGLTAKKIADIIGISENHVYKLLKNDVDFWFWK